MNNPKVLQLRFKLNHDEISYEFNALVKPTENPQKFHVLRVQSSNHRENASVIDDFCIVKIVKDNAPVWVHADAEISSVIVKAIGHALDMHRTSALQ